MIEALQLRGLSERTQEMYGRAVRQLADHDHTSPERITEEALRDSCLSRKNVTPSSRSARPIALCGITFFYEHTLQRDWTTLTCVRPPQEHTLPAILSRAAGRTLLPCVRFPRYRTCLPTLDACGLRLHEGTHWHIPAIASARRFVHVRRGKGAQDR
jgi:integrase/recombinase XerD